MKKFRQDFLYEILAERPGVAREKKNRIFFNLRHPRPPMSVHTKFQPIRSSRLAGYRPPMNVLFYYIE